MPTRNVSNEPVPNVTSRGQIAPQAGSGPLLDGTSGQAGPAVAVKIDNAPGALPQAGINQADVVVEILVEGGISRFMALFHSESPATIGPVRSARTSDVGLLRMLNRPLFAWSGGNSGVSAAIRQAPVVDVGADNAGGAYYRSNSRTIPHNLMTSSAALLAAGAGQSTGSPRPLFDYSPAAPRHPAGTYRVDGIQVAVGLTVSTFWWDPANQRYLRYQDGDPHVDSQGRQISPTNLVVIETGYRPSPADARSPEAVTTRRPSGLNYCGIRRLSAHV